MGQQCSEPDSGWEVTPGDEGHAPDVPSLAARFAAPKESEEPLGDELTSTMVEIAKNTSAGLRESQPRTGQLNVSLLEGETITGQCMDDAESVTAPAYGRARASSA